MNAEADALAASCAGRSDERMARPLRHLVPGTRWFVTFRCLEAMHLLRPDPASVALFGYWLVRALRRFPGIRLAAVVQMSNHGHLTLEDADGVLADFMEYFLGNLARAMNALRGRRGTSSSAGTRPSPSSTTRPSSPAFSTSSPTR